MTLWPPRPLLMVMDGRWSSNAEHAPNCPRCSSPNTKFCYYNNYSLSQPRYFCKGCRRYWTKGGSLRNVPVGGGCRKNRRSKSARLAQTERMACLRNSSTSFDNKSGGGSVVQDTNGSSIDLAAVFAKFLNPNSTNIEPEFDASELPVESNDMFESSNSSSPEGLQNGDSIEFEPSHVVAGAEASTAAEELMVGHEDNAFDWQYSLLEDQVVQDALWSEAATLPNFTWQPIVQLQQFDPLASDDHFKNISANLNLVADNNWTSFDLPGFEDFSRL